MLLGIEIGGTKLQLGVGRGDGVIERLVTVAAEPSGGAARIRGQILDAFREMKIRPSAVGVGFGGPVDAERGLVITSHQVPDWDGFPLAGWIREEFAVSSVTMQNDADTAALGESLFGAGRGLSPILYVNSGSGIGGGLVIDGRIYRGSGLGAIEIGHLVMGDPQASSRDPGARTLEGLASGWAIAEQGRKLASQDLARGIKTSLWLDLVDGDPSRITAATVAESARRDPDGDAMHVLSLAARTMGRALAHAVTLLSPRRVILGGGVSLIEEPLWLGPIRDELDRNVFPPFRGHFDVVTAELGQDVVVHGALALARDAS